MVFSQQPRDGFFHWSTCRNASLPTIASRAVAFLPLEVSGTRKVAATCSSSREYRPRIELISSPVGLRVTSLNRLSCWARSCSVCICLASGPEAVARVLPEALGEDDFALLGSPLEPQPVAARTRSAQAAASRIFTGGMREDGTCAPQEDAERSRDDLELDAQRLPRASCSRSIASNSALKLPLPKPSEPCRSISSKNTVGRSPSGLVKICSR